ncbi:MAG: hypothetical protein KGJ62_02495 [Armatimonadetes bacterium]|nr:hypothetical protein [Armatimonadota bacterium]
MIAAFRSVDSATPEQAELATRQLLELLHTDHASLQKRTVTACCAMAILLIVTNIAFANTGMFGVVSVAGVAAVSIVIVRLWASNASRDTAALTGLLGHSTEPRVAAALIDVLDGLNDIQLGSVAAAGLETILPTLKHSDVARLGPGRIKYLMRQVAADAVGAAARSFRVAAIRSLQQLGDSSAIPVLERLAQKGNTRLDNDAVTIAARETLPFVQERAALEGAPRELLRASAADTIQPGQLPRPAPETAPLHELLRINGKPSGPEA